jgi:hypothetical protein
MFSLRGLVATTGEWCLGMPGILPKTHANVDGGVMGHISTRLLPKIERLKTLPHATLGRICRNQLPLGVLIADLVVKILSSPTNC